MTDPGAFDPDSRPLMSVELVLIAWRRLVKGLEPWRSMPLDDRTGELRRLLEELFDGAGGINGPARRRRIRAVARRHGAFRRSQRCAEGIVVNDFAFLRGAVRRVLLARGIGDAVVRQMCQALVADIRAAGRAARLAHAEAYNRLDGG